MPAIPDRDPVTRLVLFETWGERCTWCNRPIRFDELEVDHVIPKSLPTDRLADVLRQYKLAADFDVLSLPNLVASCRGCNGTKGSRVVGDAPLLRVMLDKAAERAPKIEAGVGSFNRGARLAKAIVVIEAIHPGASVDERKSLDLLAELLIKASPGSGPVTAERVIHPGTNWYEPEPPSLEWSVGRLDWNGFSDEEQMLELLDAYRRDHPGDLLQVVSDTFDGSDQGAKRVCPDAVDQLAYAEGPGNYLAQVTFRVEYMHVAEDYADLAEAEHRVDLWITVDEHRHRVVDVIVDQFNSLDGLAPDRRRPDHWH